MTFDTAAFIEGYILSALWSSSIEEDFAKAHNERTGDDFAADCSMQSAGLDADSLTAEARKAIEADCRAFVEANLADLEAYEERMGTWRGSDTVRGANASYSGAEQAGGDFWLTRCGHGAGFWDRGLGELGERLSEAAKVYGEAYLYVTDDEEVHVA